MCNLSIPEILMLLCFGASWPFSVFKTYKTKNVQGKSIIFLSLIAIGYLSGILHKLINAQDAVIWLYVINLALVSSEIVMWFRYRKNNSVFS